MNREEMLAAAKPILFNTEMVQAIKDNRKTVTRRVIKFPKGQTGRLPANGARDYLFYPGGIKRPPYCLGDILYVPEAWRCTKRCTSDFYEIEFRDGKKTRVSFTNESRRQKWLKYIDKPRENWQSPYFMPREAARLFLRVTDGRVERLQEITELDILEKEGVTVDFPQPKPSYMSLAYTETRLKPAVRKAFADLWDSTIKPADLALYGWGANPLVWVIEFERVEAEK